MHKYQYIIDQCEIAIKCLQGILTESEYSECLDFVLKHDEWLLGLEFAIDWLAEDDREIDEDIFKEFEKAYIMMNLEDDSRLQDLKCLIR